MRSLYLLRHGKSDWEASSGSDHDRPLAGRGRLAASRVGRVLRSLGQVPHLVISSTATRALSTAELAVEAGSWECPLRATDRLYLPSVEAVLAEARSAPAEVERLMLVGHEPTWSAAVAALTGGRGSVKMVTAALARLDFWVDSWSAIKTGGATLAWLATPKLLEAAAKSN